MNSVLTNSSEDIVAEIKEMVKNIEDIKAGIDMFGEMVKQKISKSAV